MSTVDPNHFVRAKNTPESREFSPEVKAELEALAARYPNRDAILLPALRMLEREFGTVDEPGMRHVAEIVGVSAAKVYGSEGFIEIYRMLGEVVGQAGLLRSGSGQGCVEAGKIERLYRTASIITFGGGANEIQRDIISAAGLWMPRASR